MFGSDSKFGALTFSRLVLKTARNRQGIPANAWSLRGYEQRSHYSLNLFGVLYSKVIIRKIVNQ